MSKENIFTITEWHKTTFPNATLAGQLEKFIEERDEYENADRSHKLEELADVFIVACGISRFDMWQGAAALSEVQFLFSHHDKRNVIKAIDKKMAINRQRQWGCKDGYYKHIPACTNGDSYIEHYDEPLWVTIIQGIVITFIFALIFICAFTIIGSLL